MHVDQPTVDFWTEWLQHACTLRLGVHTRRLSERMVGLVVRSHLFCQLGLLAGKDALLSEFVSLVLRRERPIELLFHFRVEHGSHACHVGRILDVVHRQVFSD